MQVEFEKVDAYEPDRTLKGKLRRRLIRLAHRRPAQVSLERPMVSFSFDDAPATACEAGARVLEARGLRGTYYFAAGLAGRDGPMGRFASGEDARRLHEAGHEIACHTYSHLDCGQSSRAATLEDVDRNAKSLAAWGAGEPVSFAYPYGDVAAPAKTALSGRFKTLRALHHGLITNGADLNQTPAVGIEGEEGFAQKDRGLRIDGVASLGETVDRDDRGCALPLDHDLGHVSFPAACAAACRPGPFRPSGS